MLVSSFPLLLPSQSQPEDKKLKESKRTCCLFVCARFSCFLLVVGGHSLSFLGMSVFAPRVTTILNDTDEFSQLAFVCCFCSCLFWPTPSSNPSNSRAHTTNKRTSDIKTDSATGRRTQRERERHTHTDRHTDTQTGRQTVSIPLSPSPSLFLLPPSSFFPPLSLCRCSKSC